MPITMTCCLKGTRCYMPHVLAYMVTGWCVFCEVPCPGKEPDFRRSLPSKRKPYVVTTSVHLSVIGASVYTLRRIFTRCGKEFCTKSSIENLSFVTIDLVTFVFRMIYFLRIPVRLFLFQKIAFTKKWDGMGLSNPKYW